MSPIRPTVPGVDADADADARRSRPARQGPGSDRELSDAVEDLIHRLDFATVAELRSAVRTLDDVLRDDVLGDRRQSEGRGIIEALADLVDAEANYHEATIDRELATMFPPFPDGR